MSTAVLLQKAIDGAKSKYPSGLTDDEIFEIFCSENLLKNYDPSYDQIEAGIVDGSKDGGIDGVYVFVNRQLLEEDTDVSVFKSPVDIEVIVIQSKHQDSFKEGPIDKLASSLPILFDLSRQPSTLESTFNEAVYDAFMRYRKALGELSSQFPTIRIKVFYCSKGGQPENVARTKAEALSTNLTKSVNGAVTFEFLGADDLYGLAQAQRRYVADLPTTGTPIFGTNSFVALCKLADYANFISDQTAGGSLMTRLFEANVRAYQGDVEVNKEIAASLAAPAAGLDFWWLNNGVTIVADQAQYQNDRMKIENPLIVNGLQTSYELYRYSQVTKDETRRVLVRIIVEADPSKRDQIIKATNRQTSIAASSLRATEPVHRRIEDYLGANGLFYDRRKNFYKDLGKPADRIISIDKLAQAVMTVLLQRPHDARARPTTIIKNPSDYSKIFSEDPTTHPLEMYRVVAEAAILVEAYFKSAKPKLERIYKNNLKYHTLMVAIWNSVGSNKLPAQAIAKIELKTISPAVVEKAAKWVMAQFDSAGKEDRVAKDSAFTEQLITKWKKP